MTFGGLPLAILKCGLVIDRGQWIGITRLFDYPKKLPSPTARSPKCEETTGPVARGLIVGVWLFYLVSGGLLLLQWVVLARLGDGWKEVGRLLGWRIRRFIEYELKRLQLNPC